MGYLGESIDKDANGSVSFGLWKLDNKVDRDREPWLFWDRQRLKETVEFVIIRFAALTNIISTNIILNILLYTWPIKYIRDKIQSLGDTEITGRERVVTFLEDYSLEIGIIRNIY